MSFGWLKLPALYAILIALTHLLFTLDILVAMTISHHVNNGSVSDMILNFPPTLATGISDLLIHLAALLYCSKFTELVKLLRKGDSTSQGMSNYERLIYFGLILQGMYAIADLVVNVFWYANADGIFSALCGYGECGDYPVVEKFMSVVLFWHNGALLCATSFLVTFGFRLVKAFKKLCLNIKNLLWDGITSKLTRLDGKTFIGDDDGLKQRFEGANVTEAYGEMRKDFEELQEGFAHFSEIAGVFVMAALMETVTTLFYAAGHTLSQTDVGGFMEHIVFNLMTLILLLVIIETGNYMRNEVTILRILTGSLQTFKFNVHGLDRT